MSNSQYFGIAVLVLIAPRVGDKAGYAMAYLCLAAQIVFAIG
jgi:hypothetical protein